ASVGAYGSLYAEIVIAVFMFLFGVNFTLYYMSFKGGIKKALRDEELRFYALITFVAIALISIDTYGKGYHTFWEALRHSSFQVSSVITTTGFSTQDFGNWPLFSQTVLLLLMFIGAMAGSTGGGLKCVRALILLKAIKREVKKSIHPKAASVIAINGKRAEESSVYGILVYLAIYLALIILGTLLVSINGKDFLTTSTSVISCINNVGPGLGAAGPAGNYAGFSGLSKMVLSMLMLTGRLEIFPLLMLFTPGFWRKNNI
ncbi:MAG: TrkH family potassium uptake protein, partial [Clostridiales bacterium]|nr:TrkH family potassium uptake protein [Clostridiales bacterium]